MSLSFSSHLLCCGTALAVAIRSIAGEPSSSPATNVPSVLVVVGAAGEEDFGRAFAEAGQRWENVCATAGVKQVTIGLGPTNTGPSDRERLQQALAQEPKENGAELWLVLLGHGTFDGKEAKFNLRAADLSATELASWLQPLRRPTAIINAASASGPFLAKLAGTNRVVITATRSGSEANYARFGKFFSESIADPAADLDKDGQTSLLEAFLAGSARVNEFYKAEGRLATEHALLDDNGDGLGTPSDWFRGVRAVKRARDGAALDGLRAHQFHLIRSAAERGMSAELRARRDALEHSVARLREAKAKLTEDEYYRQLEGLLLDLARLYEPAPQAKP